MLPVYTFFNKLGPPFATFDKNIEKVPAETMAPLNTQTYLKLVAFKIAPLIGVPMSSPMEMTAKPIPILVPISPRLAVK